jgi:hypothetical protein
MKKNGPEWETFGAVFLSPVIREAPHLLVTPAIERLPGAITTTYLQTSRGDKP